MVFTSFSQMDLNSFLIQMFIQFLIESFNYERFQSILKVQKNNITPPRTSLAMLFSTL